MGFANFGNDLYTGKRSINFIGRSKIFFVIASLTMLIALTGPWVIHQGYKFGIEFTGGTSFQISGVKNQDPKIAEEVIAEEMPSTEAEITEIGKDQIRVETDQLSAKETTNVSDALAKAYDVPEENVTASFIGASWGEDITRSAITALIVFIVFVSIVLAIYFRTWKMSLAAVISLLHDLILTSGIYGIFGVEITPAAMIGFLTILGYSLYDTVVVFDKIRENTKPGKLTESRTFAESVNLAVNQTLVRSINTSVVALLPVGSILFIGTVFLGAGTLLDISLALFIGIFAGAYSTIFVAAPIYAALRKREKQIKKHDERVLQLQNAE